MLVTATTSLRSLSLPPFSLGTRVTVGRGVKRGKIGQSTGGGGAGRREWAGVSGVAGRRAPDTLAPHSARQPALQYTGPPGGCWRSQLLHSPSPQPAVFPVTLAPDLTSLQPSPPSSHLLPPAPTSLVPPSIHSTIPYLPAQLTET